MPHLWLLTLLLSYLTLPSYESTFYFSSTPTQCGNMTIEWTGGQAPFTILFAPVGHLHPETRRIIQNDVQSGNSVSFVLDLPARSQFVAVLNDASGIGAGGTSAITTVGPSSDSSCLNTTPSQPKFLLFLPEDIGQCDPVDISWGPEAEEPVDIFGLIPDGESFEIANVSDSSTSVQLTANVRSGTQIIFVAGDKDGLGSGGSSDVMGIGEGDSDGCIGDTSPSSTTGAAAGGVSSTSQDSSGTRSSSSISDAQTAGGSTDIVTTDNVGSTVTVEGIVTTDGWGSTRTVISSPGMITTTDNYGSTKTGADPITTTDNAGSTITVGGGGSTGTGAPGLSSSELPGSGGGTVTGRPSNETSDGDRNLSLILGLVFGLLALGLTMGGIFLYRRRRRGGVYRNLETGGNLRSGRHPWVTAFTRGARLRGGASSSIDTLPSMYQTEPFFFPSDHEQYVFRPKELPPVQQQRPDLATRVSSSFDVNSLLGQGPFTCDAFGNELAGVHGADRKGSTSPHGRSVNRTSSSRVVTRTVFPHPPANDLPTRVTRDYEDFSSEPEETALNPFDDAIIELPPTYASVRRASRRNVREPWQPVRAQLMRSNASRVSRMSLLFRAVDESQDTT